MNRDATPPLGEHPADHPEDLIDQARGGHLGSAGWLALREHLSACPICAAQVQLAPVTEPELNPTARDTYVDRLAAQHVLRRLKGEHAPRAWKPMFLPRRLRLGFAILLFSGTAAAASWWSVRTTRQDIPAPVDHPKVRGGESRLGSDLFGPPADRLPVEAAFPTEVSANRVAPPTRRLAHDKPPSAAELFDRARELRLAGNIAGARTQYLRLQRAYADSPQSHMSYLIVGRMWLKGAEPHLAAAQFAEYLSTGGGASEEALVGHATALAEIGRRSEEAADWQTLLSRHPESVYAGRARARLGELGQSSTKPRSGAGSR